MPLLVTNPIDDDAFRRAALAAVQPGMTADELGVVLRGRYPSVAVHERLISAEPEIVWYVYREGRWVGRDGHGGKDGHDE